MWCELIVLCLKECSVLVRNSIFLVMCHVQNYKLFTSLVLFQEISLMTAVSGKTFYKPLDLLAEIPAKMQTSPPLDWFLG